MTFTNMKDISVCIVDDNTELRNALEEIISMSDGYICVATIGSAEEAISRIPMLLPDVVLMDINLGTEANGIDCVRVLKPRITGTNFMMCTVYEESEKIFEALSAGASGYILKKTDPSRLLEAIKELYEGGAPMSSQIARKVVTAFQHIKQTPNESENSKVGGLSSREKEILELLSKGLMYKEIAAELFLSGETVRKHVYNIYEKLHVNNRVSAINKYFGR
jgi:DNA-binding NarL/FixJ family response regulator